MSVTQKRRERERQELRSGILAAAREIAARDGWQAVTIRKVAEAVEYSPPMIYEYFPSKESILIELLQIGFVELRDALRAACAAATPDDTLTQIGIAYWRFAMTNPELYQVMHGLGGVPFGTMETPIEAREGFLVIRDAVAVATHATGVSDPLDPTDPLNDDTDLFWGALHGLVALSMAGRIAGEPERAAALVLRAVRVLVAGWQRDTPP